MRLHGLYFTFLTTMVAVNSIAGESCPTFLFPEGVSAPVARLSDERPESAVFIALGHDSKIAPLESFARDLETQLQRRVVTYRQFTDVYYILQPAKWWEGPRERTTALVEQALRRAVSLYPDAKIIAFNLDGYDPQDLFRPAGQEESYYTNFEVRLLLRDRSLFLATRWYRNGSEFTVVEAKAFWRSVRARFERESSRRISGSKSRRS